MLEGAFARSLAMEFEHKVRHLTFGKRVLMWDVRREPDDSDLRHYRIESLATVRDLVMKERTAHPAHFPQLGRRVDPEFTQPETSTAGGIAGIEVHEEEWGTVTAQHIYKLRCECGRSWFELELPKVV